MWHQRGSTDNSGVIHAQSGRYHAFGQNVGHVLQDCNNGSIYLANQGFPTENGTAISRIRRTPHLRGELVRAALDHVRLLIDAGGAAEGIGGGAISLRVSNDYGNTWSPYYTQSMGATGDFTTLVEWFHLGYGNDWVLELSSTSPVFQAWIEGYASYRQGRSKI
jgi:hypothetical protein